jgi:RNA polymerase sigma-70 factor (ECF subfamily)
MNLTDQELAALYDRYAHVIFRRCRAILGNEEDAHDAVQETFSRVIRHYDEFRGQASPLTWMYRISTNYCLNQIRNRSGRRDKIETHKHEIGGDASAPLEGGLDHALVRKLLDDCDEEMRACVIHTFFDDCTRQETADLVGLSVPTVRKRVNEFLERARLVMGMTAVATVGLLSLLLWRP